MTDNDFYFSLIAWVCSTIISLAAFYFVDKLAERKNRQVKKGKSK